MRARWIVAVWLMGTWGLLLVHTKALGEDLDPGPLIEKLASQGRDQAFLRRLFGRPEVRLDPMVMVRKVVHREARLDYGRFLKPSRINRARGYLVRRDALLNDVGRRYGVSPELLVAILLVESDLGARTGTKVVFNTLASMASLERFDQIRPLLPREARGEGDLDRARRRFERARRWSFKELAALLDFSQKGRWDPLGIRGSIFGAFGLCQFIPTSALRYGTDWDGDGRVDLFEEGDALASMANYLRAHGWRKGLDEAGERAVIFRYNRSRPYVETILTLVDRLKRGGE